MNNRVLNTGGIEPCGGRRERFPHYGKLLCYGFSWCGNLLKSHAGGGWLDGVI